MQPTPTNRPENLATNPETSFDEAAPATRGDAMPIDGLASESDAGVADTVTADRTDQRNAGRSIALWMLPLLGVAVLAVIAFAAWHRQPVNDQKSQGPGYEGTPNAAPDNKRP